MKYEEEYKLFLSKVKYRKFKYSTYYNYRLRGKSLEELIELGNIKKVNERGGRRKRTQREIDSIKGAYSYGTTLKEIGEEYNLTPQRIWAIINR